ncbi:DUF2997 domain-containing protein [Actinoplanes derwentensis]|uniref:DUF2997 domain-containing protein n=1 Tax=Actinoplanes derwentensis TaxID=113562 RepID=A0A1H1UNF9_9ACTN|nr:DUF2997 domain-containing protein [Actinoplanes derwentensis]GID88102.1 hypothetical protein Ade03nite_70260 [Actinoplanes derwentensis]SDS73379.1 Protein of unknown function [Actinoplanes derwentensis]
MTGKPRIVVTVNPDGTVSAETLDILGDHCLDYIAVLEDLIDGKVQNSAFTSDYTRQTSFVQDQQVNRDVDPA